MASLALNSIFCLVVVIFCFINHNVEAREGKLFFSKFTHVDRPNSKEVAQPLAPAQAPGPAQANGRLGDGHFGAGSGMIPQTKESWPSTTTDEDFEKLMATFDEEKGDKLPEEFEEEEEGSQDPEDLNEQMDNKYNNNNKNNGYTYRTNNNYDDNRRGYGNDQEERQGMSDTRFMENGKYFYDTRGRNSETTTPSRGGYENVRGNDHPNEFETMEEYYKSLEGTQEEFEP